MIPMLALVALAAVVFTARDGRANPIIAAVAVVFLMGGPSAFVSDVMSAVSGMGK